MRELSLFDFAEFISGSISFPTPYPYLGSVDVSLHPHYIRPCLRAVDSIEKIDRMEM